MSPALLLKSDDCKRYPQYHGPFLLSFECFPCYDSFEHCNPIGAQSTDFDVVAKVVSSLAI